MAYTMKGSPFQRNFGIGSPAKQSVNVEETKEERDARADAELKKKVEIDKKNAEINLAKIAQDEKDEEESPGSTGDPNPIPKGS
tara:strand:+ start:294 stop:545 length:252 start_codon:yes stop_codon:yes gene_type:complete